MATQNNTPKTGGSWKKYFKTGNVQGQVSPIGSPGNSQANPAYRNMASKLPEVYIGHPNRIERYNQYEQMDMDSEVNAALDILAEFCSQKNEENLSAFDLHFHEKPTDNEVKIIKEQLQQWISLNELNKRIFKIVRNTIKYGDQVFIRDPETFKMFWVEMSKVTKVIVNESDGKKPEQYVVKDINPNFQNLTVTAVSTSDTFTNHPQVGGASGSYTQPRTPYSGGSRFSHAQNEAVVNAEHVVHLSLTEGLDVFWPFGNSVLENIFKVFKQKELLEDAIIIYRVQRAPERRMFKIDVGNMPTHMAMAFVERIKNEISQRRIPTQTQGGVNMMDATYNPLCLDLTTKIPLLDGRTLQLSELITEFDAGKENWAYSCNPETGKVVPGLINWAGVTRKDTEVIEITFDNGKTLTCTPDHKIPVFGKGFVEAKDLTTEDSLIAFNTRKKSISGGKTNQYEQVWDHESKTWEWTHRLVGEFFRKLGKHQEFTYLEENITKSKVVIHHKDNDRFNNDPRNLTYMNKEDHILYHAAQKKDFWETMSDEYRLAMTSKISETLKENWVALTEEERLVKLWNIRAAQKKSVWARQNDPLVAEKYKVSMRASRKAYFEKNPVFLEQSKRNLESRVKIKNQELTLTFDMLQEVVNIVKTQSKKKATVISLCDKNTKLLSLVKEHNSTALDYKNAHCKIDFDKFGYSKLERLIEQFGYSGWKHFVSEVDNFNHRIVSIKKVSNRDTGTITIDGYEKWHNYHTFAVDGGIFVKNSTNEDFFFPQTADGRGSSVEILQGGQNLGEITDLKFFTNKLFRGLRIPSSYLPTGADDGTTAVNDGKVGTALIQEWRFNQYCLRLQSMIVDKLDTEFKMFMRWRGINIDGQIFDLRFNQPQNFASYRQADIDNARISTFTQLEQYPYFSKRFLMKRYLGMSEVEMSENEMQWAEEKGKAEDAGPGQANLRNVGVTPGGLASDLENVTPEPGAEGAAGGALDMGGAAGGGVGSPTGGAGPAASAPGVGG